MSSKLSRRDLLKLVGAVPAVGMLSSFPYQLFAQEISPGCASNIDWNPTYPPFEKYDPPVNITVPYGTYSEWLGVDDFFNNPMANRITENLGITYPIHWQATGEQRTQQFSTDIASGELADMFSPDANLVAVLIENDLIEDITDIWEATASDLVKAKKQYPNGNNWITVKRGERIFGVAFTYGPGYNIDNMGFIRQDWLDQLGLAMPSTVDELTNTIRAFRDAGLCSFGINACQRLVTWYQSLDPIFGAFGGMPKTWRSNPDGTLRYGSIDPQIKDALAVIRGWYADGLMDPDFFTYNEGDAASNIMAERVGVWFSPWWSAGTITRPGLEQLPGANIAILPLPSGPGGMRGRKASSTRGDGVVFRKGIEPIKIEAAIRQLNWQMEMHVNWEQYQQYGEWRNSSAFAEGYEWKFDENCNIVAGDAFGKEYLYVDSIGFSFPWLCYPDYQADIFADMAVWLTKDESELNNIQKFILSDPVTPYSIEYYNHIVASLDDAIVDEWLGANTENITALLPDLTTMEDTAFIEIIIGERDLDDFDAFVEEWKASGGDTVTEDVNAWKSSL